jgi:hypothetical protein
MRKASAIAPAFKSNFACLAVYSPSIFAPMIAIAC